MGWFGLDAEHAKCAKIAKNAVGLELAVRVAAAELVHGLSAVTVVSRTMVGNAVAQQLDYGENP